MESKWPAKKDSYKSASVDSHVYEQLENVAASFENVDALIKFITNGSMAKVLGNWASLSQMNNHSQFVDFSVKLARVTFMINLLCGLDKFEAAIEQGDETVSEKIDPTVELQILQVKPEILAFYKDLINNHTKIIYRCINSFKPSLNNPVMKLLVNAIKFDLSMANELYNNLDLTLPAFPKLLVPTKMDSTDSSRRSRERERVSLRANFLNFWLVWLANLPSMIRKDLMMKNYKITNNIWKHMDEIDSIELLGEIFTFLNEKVLLEYNFKKLTKCFIMNENFFIKTQPIFLRVLNLTTHPFIELFKTFLSTVLDSKHGLIYPNEKLWERHNSATHHELELNNQTFKINNKSIYSLLTSLKPWESNNQMEYTMRILNSCSELVPIYLHWLVQNGGGYHDPSLTAWWISRTLLYSNIIQLPLPSQIKNLTKNISQDVKLDNKIIAETICLAPLTKSSLLKSLETNKLLITQFALQLILQMCIKLDVFLSSNVIGNKQELIELVFNALPDISSIIQVYNKSNDSKLINVTCLNIIQHYNEKYAKNSTTSSSLIANNGLNALIKKGLHASNRYDLVLLNCFLSIQSNQNHDQLKWWNKSADGNSFFTSLIKLGSASLTDGEFSAGSSADAFTWKISNLLNSLVDEKLLFKKNLLVSPILAIIYSFDQFESGLEPIWDLLDEVVSRCIRAPYRYLDLSHAKYDNTSVFVVALFEQFKYVLTKTDNIEIVSKWIFNLMKYLIALGESKTALTQLMNDFLVDEKFVKFSKSLLKILEFQGTQNEGRSYFSYIVNTKVIEDREVLTKLDMSGLVFKLELLLKEKDDNKTLIALATKLANFVLTSEDVDVYKYVLSTPFWSKFMLTKKEAKEVTQTTSIKNKLLICGILNELLHQLPISIVNTESDLTNFIFEIFQSPIELIYQPFFSSVTWVLSKKQISQLIKIETGNNLLVVKMLEQCIENHVSIDSTTLNKVITSPIPPQYEKDKRALLSNAIESNLVEYTLADIDIDLILKDKSKHFLIKSFINSSNKDEVVKYLIQKTSDFENDPQLLCFIGYSISLNTGEHYEGSPAFFEKVTNLAIQSLGSEDVEWNQLLVILTNGLKYFDSEKKAHILSEAFTFIQNSNTKNSMIPEFVNFITEFITENLTENITSWIHKSMLYVTKKFAESSELSANFDRFLDGLSTLIKKLSKSSTSMWKIIPTSIINTQLEVILNHPKWISNTTYLAYANLHILTSTLAIAFEKLLQIFINNEKNVLNAFPSKKASEARYLSSFIIYNIFNVNPAKNSSEPLLDKLILFYLGSTRAEDVLIKSLLIKIESQISKSWVVKVTNWDFSDELNNNEIELVGEDRLIIDNKTSVVVSLSKTFVKNTIRNYSNTVVGFPSVKGLPLEKVLKASENFYSHDSIFTNQIYQKTIYDVEFLMLLIINNEELLKFSRPAKKAKGEEEEKVDRSLKPVFDMNSLIESNILQLLIMNLAHESDNVKKISKVLLQNILISIDANEHFKDKNIYKVFLANILHTLKVDANKGGATPGLVWYVYSSFIPVLSNPGHFLYEKCFRYVLGNPIIKNEIPLFSSIVFAITKDSEAENDETYYRQVVWLIESLIFGTKTLDDLNILKFKDVFEWMLNLLNSPFITMRIRSQILQFLAVVESVEQGSDTLITRYGFLTNMEQNLEKLSEEKSDLLNEQLKLNIQQIVVRLGITVGGSKRVKNWTAGDLPRYIKRVKQQ